MGCASSTPGLVSAPTPRAALDMPDSVTETPASASACQCSETEPVPISRAASRGLRAHELDRVAGEEEADLVPLVDRGPGDEEREGGTGRVLGPKWPG